MRKSLLIASSAIALVATAHTTPLEDLEQGFPQLQNFSVRFLNYDNDGKIESILRGTIGCVNIT